MKPRATDPRKQVLQALRELEEQGLKLPIVQLENLADLLLDTPAKRGRKVTREYPWLTRRQLKDRMHEFPAWDPSVLDNLGQKRHRRAVGDQ